MKELEDSKTWWERTKADPEALNAWLKKQYHGEITAADRIELYALTRCSDPEAKRYLEVIANDERRHARWVAGLLENRELEAERLTKSSPYWDATLEQIDSFGSACAVAALAEKMRLERIEVIANDPNAPEDIRSVFCAILKDEVWHERMFRKLAGEEELSKAAAAHRAGREAIGLITPAEVL